MLYITPRELAAVLAVSAKTIDRMLTAGRLPAPVRAGGPKGSPGWRRWPVGVLVEALQAQGRPVPPMWLTPESAAS